MNKLVIIINGQGGAGKDTLCEFAGEAFKITNISLSETVKSMLFEKSPHRLLEVCLSLYATK